ncbi:hypothetical protein RFI_17605, partial [Reticulomyxa filosa]
MCNMAHGKHELRQVLRNKDSIIFILSISFNSLFQIFFFFKNVPDAQRFWENNRIDQSSKMPHEYEAWLAKRYPQLSARAAPSPVQFQNPNINVNVNVQKNYGSRMRDGPPQGNHVIHNEQSSNSWDGDETRKFLNFYKTEKCTKCKDSTDPFCHYYHNDEDKRRPIANNNNNKKKGNDWQFITYHYKMCANVFDFETKKFIRDKKWRYSAMQRRKIVCFVTQLFRNM